MNTYIPSQIMSIFVAHNMIIPDVRYNDGKENFKNFRITFSQKKPSELVTIFLMVEYKIGANLKPENVS